MSSPTVHTHQPSSGLPSFVPEVQTIAQVPRIHPFGGFAARLLHLRT
jgi:hypothetical protein